MWMKSHALLFGIRRCGSERHLLIERLASVGTGASAFGFAGEQMEQARRLELCM